MLREIGGLREQAKELPNPCAPELVRLNFAVTIVGRKTGVKQGSALVVKNSERV